MACRHKTASILPRCRKPSDWCINYMCAFFLPRTGRCEGQLRNRYFSPSPWEWPAFFFSEFTNTLAKLCRSLPFMISAIETAAFARCPYIKACMRVYGSGVERLRILAIAGHRRLAFDNNDWYAGFVRSEFDRNPPRLNDRPFGSYAPLRLEIGSQPGVIRRRPKRSREVFCLLGYRLPSRKCHASYDAYQSSTAIFRRNMSSIQAV